MSKQARCFGCFYGGIVGDALGAPIEFKIRDKFEPIKDMNVINFNFGLEPGGWTDDTSMMLCLAQSLIEKQRVDKKDNLEKYSKWFRSGYMSVKDHCVDIGYQTSKSILDFESNGSLVSKFNQDKDSGNGGIMRIGPVPIFYYNRDIQLCIKECEESSITTHSSQICRDAARYIGCILYLLINGIKRDHLIEQVKIHISRESLCEEILDIYDGKYLEKERKEIHSSGYVIHTLEAALYSFFKFDTFKDSVLFSVNLGNDSDTVGCVTAMICGAFYGINAIPEEWINKLHKLELLQNVITNLWKASKCI